MEILLIKTEALLSTNKLMQFHDNFVKQFESGVVIIPAYFDAKILSVPNGVEVIVESDSKSEFMSKKFNV